MPFVIAGFTLAPYAALLGLIYVFLSSYVANLRRREREGLGATHPQLQRGARAHGNFIEYVPFALLLFWLCGHTGSAPLTLHLLGLALLVGRSLHAYGILVAEPKGNNYLFRASGMLLTLGAILVASVLLLIHWLGYTATT